MGKEAKFVVRLNDSERQSLEELLAGKRVAADKILRGRILLKADVDGPAWSDPEIADAFNVGLSTVHRLRQRLVEEGLEATLARRPSSQQRLKKIDGAKEAHLIAITCGSPPEGRARLPVGAATGVATLVVRSHSIYLQFADCFGGSCRAGVRVFRRR